MQNNEKLLSIYINPPACQSEPANKYFQEPAETASLVDFPIHTAESHFDHTNNGQFALLTNKNLSKMDLFTTLSFPKQEEIELETNNENFPQFENDHLLEDMFKQQSRNLNHHCFKGLDTLQMSQNNTLQFPKFSEFSQKQQLQQQQSVKQEQIEQQQEVFTIQQKQDSQQSQNLFEFPDFDLNESQQGMEDDENNSSNTQNTVDEKQQQLPIIQDQEDHHSNTTEEIKEKQLWKVKQKAISKKKKQRDYDKNICRYLARCIVRCFVDKTYMVEVSQFCSEVLSSAAPTSSSQKKQQNMTTRTTRLYQSSTSFLLSKIEFITGHRAFRDLLCYDEEDEYLTEKQVFRKFTYWFLKERAFRYIITGAMTDKQSYLKFKNEIMLLYVNKPEKWNSNTKKSQRKLKEKRSL